MRPKQKVLLIILDGLGAAPEDQGNAVVLANPTNLSTLWNTTPHTYLLASGEAVGLPANIKGNSEVGHMNIGAGRVVIQTLPRINQNIERGLFFKNNVLIESLNYAKKNHSRVHLLGLTSDGGAHSHIDHFLAVIRFFAQNNFENELFIHAFTDGRDTPPDSAKEFLDMVNDTCEKYSIGKIATLCGRSWAMDRNKNWQRTKKAYDLLTQNIGLKQSSYEDALAQSYAQGMTDEFLEPTVITPESNIQPNDVVLFLNFRPDRALQLSQALADSSFTYFQRVNIQPMYFASMVEYRKNFPSKVLFPKQYITLPLGNIVASMGLRQLRIAESEKFPHVTYFFNGGMSVRYSNEDRIEVPSPAVATYDLKPEMSAFEVTDILMNRIDSNIYDLIVLNFANPDMVAHTGDMPATIKAISTVDHCVNELVKNFTRLGGAVIITADHGNAEEVINIENGEIDTEHSLNPVPFMIAGVNIPAKKLKYGALKDITPTILDIMGIPKPTEMTGTSLINSTNFLRD